MPVDPRHRDIARIALDAAGDSCEIALAGGNALMLHDIVSRRTHDVDLFVAAERAVGGAAELIAGALTAAGYEVGRIDKTEGLGDLWPETLYGYGLLPELEVTRPGWKEPVVVQIAHFQFSDTVNLAGVGRVLARHEVAGWKTVALVSRKARRDYVDVAALLAAGFTVAQLISLAKERDPGLADEDFAAAAVALDRTRDSLLRRTLRPAGMTAEWLRAQFKEWPRSPLPEDYPGQHSVDDE